MWCLDVALGLGTACSKSSLTTARCDLKTEQSSGCKEHCHGRGGWCQTSWALRGHLSVRFVGAGQALCGNCVRMDRRSGS